MSAYPVVATSRVAPQAAHEILAPPPSLKPMTVAIHRTILRPEESGLLPLSGVVEVRFHRDVAGKVQFAELAGLPLVQRHVIRRDRGGRADPDRDATVCHHLGVGYRFDLPSVDRN